ncbi:MAG TPA: SUF system NifU family Fe-S cluster assembly protein [Gemmatimonadaceae bacterium]|nr:SUF system NifU family Fe-S cluster assembly protein [Gemmatimonadaceae bacterium]
MPSERDDGRDARLQAVYQELLLDHYRRPRNKGALEGATVAIPMRNPLCGDEIELRMILDGDVVRDVKFTGQGCSISQATASMMTQLVKGKTVAEAEALRERFRQMMFGDADAAHDKALGDLRALAGVARLPVRVKCALLAWNALEEGIRRDNE